MDALPVLHVAHARLRGSRFYRTAIDVTCIAAVALVWCLALLLWQRRAAGALQAPLGDAMLAAVGLILGGLVFALSTEVSRSGWIRYAAGFVGALAVAAALSLSGSPPVGIAALWSLILAGLLVPRGIRHRGPRASDADSKRSVRAVRIDPPHTPQPHFPAIEIAQQVTRGRTESGQDICQGTVRTRFAEGQRTDVIHLAFCPPFQSTPRLEVESEEGPEVDVKLTQTMPYGARLDLRLDKIAPSDVTVGLRFSAVEAAPAKVA